MIFPSKGTEIRKTTSTSKSDINIKSSTQTLHNSTSHITSLPSPTTKKKRYMTSLVVFSPSHLKNMNSSMLDHHPQVGVKINQINVWKPAPRWEKKGKNWLILPGKLTMSPKNQWVVQIVFSHWNSPFLGDEFVRFFGGVRFVHNSVMPLTSTWFLHPQVHSGSTRCLAMKRQALAATAWGMRNMRMPHIFFE